MTVLGPNDPRAIRGFKRSNRSLDQTVDVLADRIEGKNVLAEIRVYVTVESLAAAEPLVDAIVDLIPEAQFDGLFLNEADGTTAGIAAAKLGDAIGDLPTWDEV